MKKLIFLVVIGFAAWHYYENQGFDLRDKIDVELSDLKITKKYASNSDSFDQDLNFTCDGRQYCSQMTSRKEAEFFLENCPDTKMDGDLDGIPCENDSRF
ncbi:excalibur calcium-binding domain-containing protein [Photobacterium leiognathi]|uniref:excalibur calcium-binding domain-containing protein n=1 Tax=Photobacterium leiognathi TaxID=553611 RepID=UPI002735CD57|nr:excalibur calcium-binding domain-containing protein [Photobacterium leiognathi]